MTMTITEDTHCDTCVCHINSFPFLFYYSFILSDSISIHYAIGKAVQKTLFL